MTRLPCDADDRIRDLVLHGSELRSFGLSRPKLVARLVSAGGYGEHFGNRFAHFY